MTYTATGIVNISGVSRDHMDVGVVNRLTRHLTAIDANVECACRMSFFKYAFNLSDKVKTFNVLGIIEVKYCGNMTSWDNQNVSRRHRKSIENSYSLIILSDDFPVRFAEWTFHPPIISRRPSFVMAQALKPHFPNE